MFQIKRNDEISRETSQKDIFLGKKTRKIKILDWETRRKKHNPPPQTHSTFQFTNTHTHTRTIH